MPQGRAERALERGPARRKACLEEQLENSLRVPNLLVAEIPLRDNGSAASLPESPALGHETRIHCRHPHSESTCTVPSSFWRARARTAASAWPESASTAPCQAGFDRSARLPASPGRGAACSMWLAVFPAPGIAWACRSRAPVRKDISARMWAFAFSPGQGRGGSMPPGWTNSWTRPDRCGRTDGTAFTAGTIVCPCMWPCRIAITRCCSSVRRRSVSWRASSTAIWSREPLNRRR